MVVPKKGEKFKKMAADKLQAGVSGISRPESPDSGFPSLKTKLQHVLLSLRKVGGDNAESPARPEFPVPQGRSLRPQEFPTSKFWWHHVLWSLRKLVGVSGLLAKFPALRNLAGDFSRQESPVFTPESPV